MANHHTSLHGNKNLRVMLLKELAALEDSPEPEYTAIAELSSTTVAQPASTTTTSITSPTSTTTTVEDKEVKFPGLAQEDEVLDDDLHNKTLVNEAAEDEDMEYTLLDFT